MYLPKIGGTRLCIYILGPGVPVGLEDQLTLFQPGGGQIMPA